MNINITNAIVHSDLGYMRPVANPAGLIRLDWQQTPFQNQPLGEGTTTDIVAARELANYLHGELQSFTVPVDFKIFSPAMRKWYQTLLNVPYGHLWTYAQLAEAWGNASAARPAGQACRRNPIPIIIPCHRIITSEGGLNQYSGGSETTPTNTENLQRKIWLQTMEASHLTEPAS